MKDVESPGFTLGIVGAGAMGSGIVQVALTGGLPVLLADADKAQLDKGRDAIFARLDRLAEKGEQTAAATAEAKSRLRLAADIEEFARCDAVIEAIVENLDVKRQLFQGLEAVVSAETILASNTSSLPIAAIAKTCRHRGRIAGMHFFNPVPLMRLVEIIEAAETDPAVIDALMRLGRRLGRTPVRVKDAPGFLVNLGGRAFGSEALQILLERVATPEDVDQVMRECCGFRMGPFELMDLTGIDVNYPVSRIIHEGYFHDPRLKSTPFHESLFQAGRLGRKTGAGFYRYGADGKKLPSLPGDPSTRAQGKASPERLSRDRPPGEPPGSAKPVAVVLGEAADRLKALAVSAEVEVLGRDDGKSPILVAPWGEDCTSAAVRLELDARRTVAIDLSHDTARRITMMTAPGAEAAIADQVAALLLATGRAVTRIKDSPGFIAQRITVMVANLGCEMAQMGLASPQDIDTAMKLGLNYPAGPLELADRIGVKRTYEILCRLQEITGFDRYRPSPWLRRRALLGLPAATPG